MLCKYVRKIRAGVYRDDQLASVEWLWSVKVGTNAAGRRRTTGSVDKKAATIGQPVTRSLYTTSEHHRQALFIAHQLH